MRCPSPPALSRDAGEGAMWHRALLGAAQSLGTTTPVAPLPRGRWPQCHSTSHSLSRGAGGPNATPRVTPSPAGRERAGERVGGWQRSVNEAALTPPKTATAPPPPVLASAPSPPCRPPAASPTRSTPAASPPARRTPRPAPDPAPSPR
ncbi:hypothetical protein Ddc_20844 [Ditylenchus destructor]|nr:hypothetical protein Ddc_20844 [Ditylenchus destructor]